MRVFFVVKAIQIINSCVIVALLLGEYRLCGKATVDRVSHTSHCTEILMHFK